MTDNKKDIIIQVEIASSIYQQIEGLKTALGKIAVPKIDTTQISKIDWSKDMPKGATTIMIRSSFDPSFSKNFKHAKAALNSLKASAAIPIKIAPIDATILSQIKAHDWEKLQPPDSIKESINVLNGALSTLGNRLTTRRVGGKGGTSKSLAQIIQETSDAFQAMAGSASMAASAVGGIKTAGIASNPAATRGGKGKKSDFDPTTFTLEEQRFYADKRQGLNDRELKNLQNQMSANARLRQSLPITGDLAKNNLSGMQDMGGLKGAMSRVLLFGSATSVLYGGISAIRKAIEITVELENEMVQLQKVMNDTTPFEEMKKELFEISSVMGVSVLESTKLAKIWAQQGFEMNDTLTLVKASMMAMNSLNITTAQSTDFLTSVTRVWGVELTELKKVMAGVMRVQADYAIESEDLTVILTRIGSGVRAAGDSMAFLSGVATAMRETTRKTASQIFTSLKTIYAKSFSTEVIQALQDVGVYAKMSSNQFRPFSDILTELAGKWKTLTDVERRHLAITIGQTRYWSDFFAIMENFNIAQSATLSFYRAWDDASKASELQQQSLKNTLQGVFTSFAKIGDTFGTKFFTPLIKGLSAPIKIFANVMAKLGGAQSAIVMAAGLALLGGAFKTMFGHFPAYEKWLGRNKLAGDAFARSVYAQRTAIMTGISAHTKFGLTIRYIANHLQLLTGKAGTATAAVRFLSVAMARAQAIGSLLWVGIKNVTKSLLTFGAWTLAFWAAGEAISFLVDRFKSAEKAAKEFMESIPPDALEKINSLGTGGIDKDGAIKKGDKISTFGETYEALNELSQALIEKERELSTENNKHVFTWKEIQGIIEGLSYNSVAVLKKNYGDLNTAVYAQQKLWEDLQTTVVATQKLIFGDVIKKSEEAKTALTTGFSAMHSDAFKFKAEFSKITGLSGNDFLNKDKLKASISKNILTLAGSAEITRALNKLDQSVFKKGISATDLTQSTLNRNPNATKELVELIYENIIFATLTGQQKADQYLAANKLDFGNIVLGTLSVKEYGNIEEARKAGGELFDAYSFINKVIEDEAKKFTGQGDFDKVVTKNEGWKAALGELFIELPNKGSKAYATLAGELKKIELLYNSGALDPKDILKEQEKAYSSYANSIVSDYTDANRELQELSNKRNKIISIIQADPNTEDFMKGYAPGSDVGDYFVKLADQVEKMAGSVEEDFNSAANGAEVAAAAGNKVFAENAKKLKGVTTDLEEQRLTVRELADAYTNLKATALDPLAKISMLLERQALYDKITKQNREFLTKQSIDYLKQELNMQEEVGKLLINAEYTRISLLRNGYVEFEKTKEKELALHRLVALRKTEIDFEERKKQILNEQKAARNVLMFPGIAITLPDDGRTAFQKYMLEMELDSLNEALATSKDRVNAEQDIYDNTQRIVQSYSIWNDYSRSVLERAQFIRDTLADSITDFARINETNGLSVLTDTIGKIGKRFQEEQAKIFVNSVISSKIGSFVLPSEEDIKFTERLAATRTAFFESVYGAMHQGAIEIATIFNARLPEQKIMDRYQMESEAAGLKDLKKAANIAAIGNLAATMGLSFLGGNDQNKQQGSQIGSIVGMVLPKLLGANPVVASLVSVASLFAGGALGSLFGGETDQKQDTMIGQLKLIEQNTARVADLTEKMVNIPGSVFLPPTGGFVIQGGLTINADGIRDPQAVADVVVGRLSQEFGLSSRRSGDRGRF